MNQNCRAILLAKESKYQYKPLSQHLSGLPVGYTSEVDYQLYICGLQVGYRVRGFQSGYKSFRSYMRIRIL